MSGALALPTFSELSAQASVLMTSLLLYVDPQVLSALRHKVDAYACSVENFESLLVRGQKFLFQRDKRYLNERRRSRGAFLRATATTENEDDESAIMYQNGNSNKNANRFSNGLVFSLQNYRKWQILFRKR